ncbi:MAG: hypothetical protein HKP62_04440, partial [Sulfurovum sp.]|nr:hypothetical protein [Sulfurovum sp.]NNJ45247.1 hypothetical protein [Sulfurovum sp.]
GDSTAASALRRVTGVTLVDGRNIYVRGLGERYSNVELNSLPLPSPNPTKRTVPLDIFPSSVIGSMKIQKSASADIPSSFGGGYIDIRTKDRFDEDFIEISLSGKINNYTGTNQINYVGSSSDWTGYDSGYREISSEILEAADIEVGQLAPSFDTSQFTKEELSNLTSLYINRLYGIYPSALKPGFGGSIEGAKSFDVDDHHITLYANYSYGQESRYVPEKYYGYDFSGDGTLVSEPTKYGTIDRVSTQIAHGGMFNLGYNYLDVLRLKYTKLYTKNSDKTTRVVDGIIGSDYNHLTMYFLDWEEREMNVDQINGDIDYEILNLKSNFKFGFEHSTAEFYQPNNYKYLYLTRDYQAPYMDTRLSNNLATRVESDDTLNAMFLNNRHELNLFNEGEYVEYGINISSKERISKQSKFTLDKTPNSFLNDRDLVQDIDTIYSAFVLPGYPYEYRPFLVDTRFSPADYYDGYIDETSPYLSWMSKPLEDLEVVLGLRYVNLDQTIYQYKKDSTNNSGLIVKEPSTLAIDDVFPSLSIKYKHSEKQYIDLAVSKTYIMPDMREFTAGLYAHPSEVANIVGNPDLVYSLIYNLDFQYSYFYSDDENVKLGLFYKYMDKPIEDVQLPSSSLPLYSFINSESATLYGFEIDGRKKLDFIDSSLAEYYISGNFSYNFSEVTLTEEQKETYTSDTRELQGLSPYVFKLTL